MSAIIIHDTQNVIEADSEACTLFRCERVALIGFSIIDLIYAEDFRGLALLRMRMLREYGHVPPVEYVLLRFDGTLFCGRVNTVKLEEGRYQSNITFKYEIRNKGRP